MALLGVATKVIDPRIATAKLMCDNAKELFDATQDEEDRLDYIKSLKARRDLMNRIEDEVFSSIFIFY